MRTIGAITLSMACGGTMLGQPEGSAGQDGEPSTRGRGSAPSVSDSGTEASHAPACSDGVLFEPSANLLSRWEEGKFVESSKFACDGTASSQLWVAVQEDGRVLALTRDGQLWKVRAEEGRRACERLTDLVPPPVGYRGLGTVRIGGEEALVTLRLGTVEEYYRDGAYHHRVQRIDARRGDAETLFTFDQRSYPDEIHGLPYGRILVVNFGGVATVVDLLRGEAAAPIHFEPTAPWLASAVTGAETLWAIGDIHHGEGLRLPVFELHLATGKVERRNPVGLPGGSAFGFSLSGGLCSLK